MHCPHCSSEQSDDRKFCTNCGKNLAAACTNCGNPLEPHDKFCGECGTAVPTAATTTTPPESPTADPGERRHVTVLFADLVSFTTFSESRDPEEVRDMLTRYFDVAHDIMERFGGEIDKFIGDAVMAVWGATVAREDDAERGVRAALELVDAVTALGEEIGVPELQARAGVMSGETSVGPGGNEKGLVVGDLVNVASRLQSIADPGMVFVGAGTVDLAGRGVEFEEVGARPVKGKTEPVATWRAVRIRSGVGGAGRDDGLIAPFVGREQELRLLKATLEQATTTGVARLLSIVGERGIGKSRLIEEFGNYVDGLIDDVFWHEGRSPSYGEGLTFWALGEMVRSRCGIVEGDDEHRSLTRLRTALAEYVAESRDREWIEPRLAGLLGLSPMPEGDKSEDHAAWRAFFEAVADRGPVVMVFEDLQWADLGLIDFVADFVSKTTQPIVFVTLARPELLERRPSWGAGLANATATHLGVLPDAAIDDLVSGMVQGIPAELAGKISARAGGVPLYAVEMVRMLVHQGTLQRRGDSYELVGEVSELAIPDSLHGVVGARLDQLDEADRRLIQDAALLGESFTVDGLAVLHGGDTDGLRQRLDGLVARSLLSVDSDPRSPERGHYEFVQSLIREVAYARLTKSERRRRHLDVAEYLESLDDPEIAGAIAAHITAALEATSDSSEAAALASRALASLETAAVRAFDLHSYDQALSLLLEGVELAADDADRGRLLTRASRAANHVGDPRAEELAQSAITAYRSADDEDGVLDATTALALIHIDHERTTEGVELLVDLLGDAPTQFTPEYARATAEVARGCMIMERNEEALFYSERALIVAEQLQMPALIVGVMASRGPALVEAGRRHEGTALMDASVKLGEEHDLTEQLIRALNNRDVVTVGEDNSHQLEIGAKMLELARRSGSRSRLLQGLFRVATSSMVWARWDAAVTALAEFEPQNVLDEIELRELNWLLTLHHDGRVAESIQELASIREAYEAELPNVDQQVTSGFEIDLAEAETLNGEYGAAWERVYRMVSPDTHGRDWFFATQGLVFTAMLAGERKMLESVSQVLADADYLPAQAELGADLVAGALAVLDGDSEGGTSAMGEALDRLQPISNVLEMAYYTVAAATIVGADTEIGYELGRRAYDICHNNELRAIAAMGGDALIPPKDESAATA